jgi:predicted glutamine amidotransferase
MPKAYDTAMCRLFSYSTQSPKIDTVNLIEGLKQFRGWAKTGTVPVGIEAGHRDGWGAVIYKDGACILYVRSVSSADDDAQFDVLLESVERIQPDAVIAHLRKASVGIVSADNAHPFLFDSLSFCHNGSVTMDVGRAVCDGASDSRTIFHELVRAGGNPFDQLKKVSADVRAKGQYTSFTTLLCDGSKIAASLDYNPEHPAATERGFDGYYTLFEMVTPTARFVASQILNLPDATTRQFENRSSIEILVQSQA